jgi:hypothetical protein
MSDFYQDGFRRGTWTPERLQSAGLTSQTALRVAEQIYQADVRYYAGVAVENSELAQNEIEVSEGYITAARWSLGQLSVQYDDTL